MPPVKTDKVTFLKGLYTYIVSIISLGVLLTGFGMGAYTLMGTYLFPKAIDADYQYRYMDCQNTPYMVPVPGKDGETKAMTEEETTKAKAKCEDDKKAQIAEAKDVDFSHSMLTAFVLILIGVPVYILHFFYFRKHI